MPNDLNRLAYRLERELPAHYHDIAAQDIAAAAQVGLTAARRAAPVRTGALRASITAYVQPNRVVLSSPLPYAGAQERRRGYLKAGFNAALESLTQAGYAWQ